MKVFVFRDETPLPSVRDPPLRKSKSKQILPGLQFFMFYLIIYLFISPGYILVNRASLFNP